MFNYSNQKIEKIYKHLFFTDILEILRLNLDEIT